MRKYADHEFWQDPMLTKRLGCDHLCKDGNTCDLWEDDHLLTVRRQRDEVLGALRLANLVIEFLIAKDAKIWLQAMEEVANQLEHGVPFDRLHRYAKILCSEDNRRTAGIESGNQVSPEIREILLRCCPYVVVRCINA